MAVSKLDVSVVIPVYNEEESVPQLAAEVSAAFAGSGLAWECVWVDDGSKDQTVAVLARIHAESPQHRCVRHERNCGQSAAVWTGVRVALADVICTLDGDGQNPPAPLPAMARQVLAGEADMVCGVRARRQDSLSKRLSSKIANRFRDWLTGVQVTDAGCGLRAFHRRCVAGVPLFKGMHRFLQTLALLQGFTVKELATEHRHRQAGISKYGIGNRLWVGLHDCMAIRWMKKRMVWPLPAVRDEGQ